MCLLRGFYNLNRMRTFNKRKHPKIAFAFLDGDFYESIRDSLRLVLPRMQQGGVIVVDDYAREALPGAAKAVHELVSPTQKGNIRVAHNLAIITV